MITWKHFLLIACSSFLSAGAVYAVSQGGAINIPIQAKLTDPLIEKVTLYKQGGFYFLKDLWQTNEAVLGRIDFMKPTSILGDLITRLNIKTCPIDYERYLNPNEILNMIECHINEINRTLAAIV